MALVAEGVRVARWMADLESRHLAGLRFAEVSRALRALSSAYVERRHRLGRGAALDGAGKRAAFALFYGPLHFMTVRHVVPALGAAKPPVMRVLDLGCGTGVAGAAWALACDGAPQVAGVDLHPWAVEEARWTYEALGVTGRARQADLSHARIPPAGAVLAAFTLNELPGARRDAVLARLLDAAAAGSRVLIVEPIARSASPWWDEASRAFRSAGGRDDEWRFPATLPDVVKRLDRAAGLRHQQITARTLYLAGDPSTSLGAGRRRATGDGEGGRMIYGGDL
ncbi:MAG: class I SAM-dependent methyltransferase [Acidobacteriota bacterium]